jgi:hypothetical protein
MVPVVAANLPRRSVVPLALDGAGRRQDALERGALWRRIIRPRHGDGAVVDLDRDGFVPGM